jgi:hydroxymethylbilane synthase
MTLRLAVPEAFSSEGRRAWRILEGAGFEVETVDPAAEADLTLRPAEGRLDRLPPATSAAVIGLAEPRDALVAVTAASTSVADLPPGASVAVEGRLRHELLAVHRPDVTPRQVADPAHALRMLDDGELQGWIGPVPTIRAAGAADRIGEVLEPTSWLPASGRGALLLEWKESSEEIGDLLRELDDGGARAALEAEVCVLRALGAGLEAPVGVVARPHGPLLRIRALVPAAEGRRLVCAEASGRLDDPEDAGRRAAEELVARGALELLATSAPS